uniref:Uncharacterized protein n=1 Tax=Anopheles farauti TaxID=69004 RepID=A0A182Q8B2_9DIPT
MFCISLLTWNSQPSSVGRIGADRLVVTEMAEDHFYTVEYVSEGWQDDTWRLFDGLASFSAESVAPNETVDTETAEIVEEAILNSILWPDETVNDSDIDPTDTLFLSEAPSEDILGPPQEQILLEVVRADEFGEQIDPSTQSDVVIVKTRSGRVSKPTVYLTNDVRRLVQNEALEAAEMAVMEAKTLPQPSTGTLEIQPKRTPNVADEYRCATCGKMYVGKRIQRHLRDNPGHKTRQQIVQEQWATASDVQAGHNWEQFWLNTFREHKLVPDDLLATGEQGRRLTLALSALVRAVRKTYQPTMVPSTAGTDDAMYVDALMADLLAKRIGFYQIQSGAKNQN